MLFIAQTYWRTINTVKNNKLKNVNIRKKQEIFQHFPVLQ